MLDLVLCLGFIDDLMHSRLMTVVDRLEHGGITIYACLQITLLHLRTVRQFLTEHKVQHAVDVVEARVRSLYEKLSLGQWRVVRQSLCSLFQDRRVKVSDDPTRDTS